MPELPEVETMCRGIAEVAGSQITRVEFVRCPVKPISVSPDRATVRRRLVGQQIAAVERVGKRLVLCLPSGACLVFEPRMTGLVLLADPPDRSHLRLRLHLSGGPHRQLLFWDRRGLGTLSWMDAPGRAERLGPDRIGPDALIIDAESLRQRIGRSRRAVKVALMDQRAVAGIGNLYASEILFVARIDPHRPCCRLGPSRWERLAEAIRLVLAEAVRYEGSTLGDGTYRNAWNQSGRYQNHHRVYGREGERCERCRRATIRRSNQGGRSTFFCPRCQSVCLQRTDRV